LKEREKKGKGGRERKRERGREKGRRKEGLKCCLTYCIPHRHTSSDVFSPQLLKLAKNKS
jgi:hypothetical protein